GILRDLVEVSSDIAQILLQFIALRSHGTRFLVACVGKLQVLGDFGERLSLGARLWRGLEELPDLDLHSLHVRVESLDLLLQLAFWRRASRLTAGCTAGCGGFRLELADLVLHRPQRRLESIDLLSQWIIRGRVCSTR